MALPCSVGPSRSFLPGSLRRTCARTSEHAESLHDDVLSSAYWHPVWRHMGRHRQRELSGPQSQPSLGCCPSVCTRAQSECRPLEYHRPHSAMSLSSTPPHILCLWQKWHRLDQTLIFTGLQWCSGLVAPCASLALPARVHPCVRPSVDVSIFLVRPDKNAGDDGQSIVEKQKYWQAVTSL